MKFKTTKMSYGGDTGESVHQRKFPAIRYNVPGNILQCTWYDDACEPTAVTNTKAVFKGTKVDHIRLSL